MRIALFGATLVTSAALAACTPVSGQGAAYRAPRTASGTPDLNGIWQTLNTASFDIEAHAAAPGVIQALGASGAIPAGLGVVEGGELPYRPEARAKKAENFAKRLTLDPEIRCYLPGVPRATYMPYPFQIIQTPQHIMIVHEYTGAVRTVYMENHTDPPADSWMGWSNGRWEGETLVVDTRGFNDQTWFDRAGNFHSEAMQVVERYTMITPDHIRYTATITDPKVFTRPWTMSLVLYRHLEPNAQVLDYPCYAFELGDTPLRR